MSRIKNGGALAAACVALVAGFEGYRSTAYRDSVGVPTACFGETQGVRMGMRFTKMQCNAMLLHSLDQHADGMEHCIHQKADDIPPDMYRSLLSMTYNIGIGGFCRSSVVRAYNAGDYTEACENMRKFNRAGGKVLPGLDRRRRAEETICLKGAAQ